MEIVIVMFNVFFVFCLLRISYHIKMLNKKTTKDYPLWWKMVLLMVGILSLASFILQIVLLIEKEYKLGMAMALVACVCAYAVGNMLKEGE